MSIKKFLCFIIIIVSLFLTLNLCFFEPIGIINFNTSDYLELCDYKTIVIPSELIEYSTEEIETAILVELSTNNVFKLQDTNLPKLDDILKLNISFWNDELEQTELNDYTYVVGSNEFTDNFDNTLLYSSVKEKNQCEITLPTTFPNSSFAGKICCVEFCIEGIYSFVDITDEDIINAYYNTNSITDVYKIVEERLVRNAITDYGLNIINTETDIFALPNKCNKYVNNKVNEVNNYAKSINTIVEDLLGCSVEEYEAELVENYKEIMIMKALTASENIKYSNKDLRNLKEMIAKNNDISIEMVDMIFDELYICHYMMFDDVSEIINKYIMVE